MILKRSLLLIILLLGILFLSFEPAQACGGLFCQNSPVDQNAERIIFTQNRDGTITAIIQIQYTGFAEDFSWILPLPNPITAEALAVPETAMNAFIELETSTNPVFIAPLSLAALKILSSTLALLAQVPPRKWRLPMFRYLPLAKSAPLALMSSALKTPTR